MGRERRLAAGLREFGGRVRAAGAEMAGWWEVTERERWDSVGEGARSGLLERAPLRERELVLSPTLSLLGVLPATGSPSSSRGTARLLLFDGLFWSVAVLPSKAPRRLRPVSYIEVGA